MQRLKIPIADDFHVHLRQGKMMQNIVPLVRSGGVGRCVVMPNTEPPITTTEAALKYREELQDLAPYIRFMMTLYLHPKLTPKEIRLAASHGIFGVKCYPRGVTTNSESGVEDLSVYDKVFAAMESEDIVLMIHGEVPSNNDLDICVMNAEERFLPELVKLHEKFPNLRIVLEHVTTAAAVECVKSLGDTVAATITAHHLDLTIDEWAGKNHNFCKPVAKYPHDRAALRQVVIDGHPRFFMGSDSAPHPRSEKEGASGCAGVFTSPLLIPYLADCFERLGCIDRLREFTSTFGCRFHRLIQGRESITLVKIDNMVPYMYGDTVPYRAGEVLSWKLGIC